MLGEFYLISRYFKRLTKSSPNIEMGIGDDCAIVNIPKNHSLAISMDTLVCGQHFLPEINPVDLAFKSLAVNVSDLAAVGADPAWIVLALTLPKINENWLETFSLEFFNQLEYYNIQLIGGDITKGPLSITIVIYGFVPLGCSLKRSGAKPGDLIYVTGTLGDSAAGLAILQNRLNVSNIIDATYLINRHLHPTPRIFHGKILRNYANATIDLSDGFISDLNHILASSNVGAEIYLDLFPLSDTILRHVPFVQALRWALSGGEDYELCFTIPENKDNEMCIALNHLKIPLTCVGQITKRKLMKFFYNGFPVSCDWKGHEFFV